MFSIQQVEQAPQVVDTEQVLGKASFNLAALPVFLRAQILPPYPNLWKSKGSHVRKITDSVLPLPFVESSLAPPRSLEPRELPLDWILNPAKSTLSRRVVAYLIVQEAKERDYHLRSDLRIAQLITIFSEQGRPEPVVSAWRAVLNCRPEQVWPNILANRSLRLGDEFGRWYFDDGYPKPDLAILAHHPIASELSGPAGEGDTTPKHPLPSPVSKFPKKGNVA